jgi:ribonuclease T2
MFCDKIKRPFIIAILLKDICSSVTIWEESKKGELGFNQEPDIFSVRLEEQASDDWAVRATKSSLEVTIMKTIICCSVVIGMLMGVPAVQAQVKLDGYFIARSECQAYQSIKRKKNPGNVETRVDQAYLLIAKNKPAASHYLISMEAEPKNRWVVTSCGEHVVPVDGSVTDVNGGGGDVDKDGDYILAMSWQPGFCETKPDKPECKTQTEERFDASHFTLHGLWPQPRNNVFCNVSPAEVSKDKNRRWSELSELALDVDTREELNKVMPGTQSFLHRHEWIKHGTCYNGESPEKYFHDSLNIMDELNADASEVRTLFAENVGREITADQIHEAFENSFGDGVGDKIKISCKRDGNRILITEITVSLNGDLGSIPVSQALMNAKSANNIGCTAGIVDPVGLQ